MMKLDIERLIDVITEESAAYTDYKIASFNLYKGPFDELENRKKHLMYCDEYHNRQQDASWAVMEVLQLDKEQRERLHIAARAVTRRRIRTEWARLIPDEMKKQIERFIFGAPSAPSMVCAHCGCWEV